MRPLKVLEAFVFVFHSADLPSARVSAPAITVTGLSEAFLKVSFISAPSVVPEGVVLPSVSKYLSIVISEILSVITSVPSTASFIAPVVADLTLVLSTAPPATVNVNSDSTLVYPLGAAVSLRTYSPSSRPFISAAPPVNLYSSSFSALKAVIFGATVSSASATILNTLPSSSSSL